jgi:hypothetical protein
LSDWKLERAGRIKQEQLEKEQLTDNSNTCTTDMTYSIATTNTTSGSGSSDGSDGSNSGTGKIQHAALIIIGDEILNGFTTDVNLQVTTKALASIGENEE